MVADINQVYSSMGYEFKQLFQLVPQMAPLYSQYEADFDPEYFIKFTQNHWEVPIIAITLYLALIYFGPKIMKDREAFDLRVPLICWNLFLCVFSLFGAIRTVPHILYNVSTETLEESICTRSMINYGGGATGLWVTLFIYSKLPELVDTLFIVLRKKKLIFLHWYHHITVLLYCWHAFSTQAGSGLYFVAMNYSVHGVMYGYYGLMAMKAIPKWFPSYIITIGQIAQMVVGTFICCASWYFVSQNSNQNSGSSKTCHNEFSNLVAGGLMYASYLYLFVEFAVKRFIFKSGSKKNKKLENENVSNHIKSN